MRHTIPISAPVIVLLLFESKLFQCSFHLKCAIYESNEMFVYYSELVKNPHAQKNRTIIARQLTVHLTWLYAFSLINSPILYQKSNSCFPPSSPHARPGVVRFWIYTHWNLSVIGDNKNIRFLNFIWQVHVTEYFYNILK